MPQPTKGARLGGSPAHQRHILANLATALFEHGRITTTEAKARRLRPYAERLITKAKRGDLHNRREIQKVIRDKDVVHRLIADIGPFFADRQGGYTRITKTLPRKGDNAPMAVIELVQQKTVTDEAERARRVAASQKVSQEKAAPVAEPADAGATEADATGSAEATEADATGSAEATEATGSAEATDADATESAEDAAAAAQEASDRAVDAAVEAEQADPGGPAAEAALDAAEAADDAVDAAADSAAAGSADDAPAGDRDEPEAKS